MTAQPQPVPQAQVATVTELTLAIQGLLSGRFDDVWVRGEVSGCRRVASGHVYLTLKDAGACLPAVVWRSTAVRLKFAIEDGTEVLCRGTVDVYPPHGKYQLIVHEVQPIGAGALQLAFEQLRKRLGAEGLFDPARKVPIPFLPRRLALVTSKTGAAVRDLVTVIHRRFPRCEILLVSCRVQGPGSAREIACAVALADRHARVDVIVVGRGGGSLEDLQAFNEEVVARAIAACVTPIVSAVGHEVDVTIADLVADLRAATPSQAGELVVPVREELLADLGRRGTRLHHLLRMRLDRAWQRLESAAGRPVLRDPRTRALLLRRHLDQVAARLEACSPRAELLRRRSAVDDLGTRAALAVKNRLGRALAAYENRRAQVEALSPLRVLDRGYSLTRVDLSVANAAGTSSRAGPAQREGGDAPLLKSVAQVRPGDRLETEVADGVVTSRVERVSPRGPEGPR
jgi:exodeoxyribonuclease VII large subunit